MKYIKIWLVAAILVATSAVSFVAGRNYEEKYYSSESYKAACILSDAIRIEYDTVDDDEKNCTYTAYSALEEACCDMGIDTDSLLRQYAYYY